MSLLDTSAATQALDALENSLKTVLLQTGSALSNATGSDGAKLNSIRSHVDRSLPEALSRWHNALNGLSAQLTDAKAALHRDLVVSRSRNATQARSPASLDSDTVMVEAPPTQANETRSDETQTKSQPPSQTQPDTQLTKIEAQDDAEDKTKTTDKNKAKPASNQTETESENPSQLLATPSSNTNNNKPSPSIGLNLELTSTPQNLDSSSASPLPSIERPAASASNLEDPGNELANTDISAMLPGLMDFANNTMADFTNDPVFSDPTGNTDQAGGMNIDGGDSGIDDLFGEGAASMDNDLFGGDANMSFDGFAFEDLAAQNAMGAGDDGMNASFDNFLTDEFFNLPGDSGEGGN